MLRRVDLEDSRAKRAPLDGAGVGMEGVHGKSGIRDPFADGGVVGVGRNDEVVGNALDGRSLNKEDDITVPKNTLMMNVFVAKYEYILGCVLSAGEVGTEADATDRREGAIATHEQRPLAGGDRLVRVLPLARHEREGHRGALMYLGENRDGSMYDAIRTSSGRRTTVYSAPLL